LEQLNI